MTTTPETTSDDLAIAARADRYDGAWAITPDAASRCVGLARSVDLRRHVAANTASDEPGGRPVFAGYPDLRPGQFIYNERLGVAMVPLAGVLMKGTSSLFECTSTVAARASIRSAANDPRVRSIVLLIDSPGGSVAGTDDLYDEIARANDTKPVVAFIEDLGASAAYYSAVGAAEIVATRSSFVGSIGVFTVIDDTSKAFEDEGVTVHLISSGGVKGQGADGVKITDEALEHWQANVDAMYARFVAVVANRRGMTSERAMELGDGRVHEAADAQRLGLIDAVGRFEDAMERAAALADQADDATDRDGQGGDEPDDLIRKDDDMNDQAKTGDQSTTTGDTKDTKAATSDAAVEPTTQQSQAAAATLADLRAACPGRDNNFYVDCIDMGMTTEQARQYAERLDKQRGESDSAAASDGVDATDGAGDASEWPDPVGEYGDKVQAYVKQGMSPGQATEKVIRENPGLKEAAHAAANA